MLLLEHNITRKRQVDENTIGLDFDAGNSQEYKIEVI